MALHSKSALAFTLFATLLGSAASHGQEPRKVNPNQPQASATPPAEPDIEDVLKIKTNLVQVDAVVTDKQGRQVSDLRAEDFEIVEEGKTRVPEFCSYVELGSSRTADGAPGNLSAGEVRRVFVFVVSNPIVEFGFSFPGSNGGPPTTGGFATQARAQRAADAAHSLLTWFVDTQMTDLDLTAIADTDFDLGVLASFTNDREVLHAAIKQVRDKSANGSSPVIRVMVVDSDVTLQPLVKQNLRIIETLEGVISQIERLPGRKVVTFVARGTLYNPALPYFEVIRERVRKLIDGANRAQISIYTVQTKDLNPNGGNRGDDGLINLARETGGRAIYNTNDLRVGYAGIIEENRGYYLLAYNPGAEAQGRPHRLQVRVKRPGTRVLVRSEAFRPSANARGLASAASALQVPFAAKDIKMTLSPSLVNPGRGTQIATSWTIDLTDAESRSQGDSAEAFSLDLSVRVTGPDGHLLKQADRDVSFEVKAAELQNTRREGFVSKFEVDAAKPGFYRISVAVRDKYSGRVGSATRFFEVRKSNTSK